MKKNKLFLLLVLTLCITSNFQAQTIINSLSELKDRLDDDNGNFKMTPGTYYFDTTNCGNGKLFPDADILFFTGSNSTFDFTDVKFEFDSEIFAESYSSWSVQFWPVGDDNVYLNLTMEIIGNETPNSGGEAIHLDGADNRIEGFHITQRSSYPYGYGDIFGKGGGSVIGHRKRAGILVRGDRNHIKDCTVLMRSYGHGIFMQGAEDALIENCYVEGELRTVGEVLEETGTGSPADNVDFLTVWGYYLTELTNDYTFSLQEDGIRCYTTGTPYGGTDRPTTGTQIKNCTVVQMRSGVTIGWDYTNKVVENCTVLACETGYWFGSNTTATGCSGDASVGPLISEDVVRSNSTIDLTILDNYIPKIGNAPHFYFSGNGHDLTLHDGTTSFDSDIELQVGGERVGHRWLAGSGEEPLNRSGSGLTFTNNTLYPVVVESNVSSSTINSCGSVTDNGSSNSITNLTNCSYTRSCDNTADNLQAECYDSMSGIQIEDLGSNNEKAIGYIQNNDWISFNGIDMTGVTAIQAIAGTNKDGASIEVRDGSSSGTLLGTLPIPNTGSFFTYQETSTATLSQTLSGSTDIYFVFKGPGGYIFNLDKLSFVLDPCSEASYNPFLPIGAEDFCESLGIIVEDLSVFNQNIGSIHNGDYLKFSNVDFGSDQIYNTIKVFASSSSSGGNIEVRSGSVSGTLLATVPISGTGAWGNYEIFSEYTTSNITGEHDIYLVFTGSGGALFNIDNFQFYNDECQGIVYDPYTQIDALNYCEMYGVTPINGEYLGGLHDGDWIRYGSVDFSSAGPTDVTLRLAGLSTTTGYVNIMLDHPEDGTLIATTTVPQTGGWEIWQEVTVPVNQTVTGTHEVFVYFGNSSFNIDWFQFTQATSTPEAGKTYYIDNPYWDLRLGANGGQDAYTTSTSTTGSNVEWTITASPTSDFFYVDCNGGGNVPRIRTDKTENTDMQATSSAGTWTRWEFTDAGNGTFYMTTLASSDYERLQINNSGVAKMVPDTYAGSWEQFVFTEVTSSAKSANEKVALDVNDLQVSNGIKIFPNPVNDILSIVSPEIKLSNIEIYNLNGQLVFKEVIQVASVNNIKVNINNLSQGVYILNLTGIDFNTKLRLIKR